MPDGPKSKVPVDYPALLQRYDLGIKEAELDLRRSPYGIGAREGLAVAWMQRALLSGSFNDYAAADRALADAFAIADEIHAPLASRLQLDLLLHRLPEAELDMQRLERRYLLRDSPQLVSNQAELAFQRGRYAEALDGFHRSLRSEESLITLVRLSVWYARSGQYIEAASLLDRATNQNHADTPYLAAWLELQQGLLLLDRGRWEQANECYLRSEQLLPGWWLPRSRRAEVFALQGRREEALAVYEPVANETGDPEFMDAIARLRRESPDPASAAPWIQRAAAVHAARLKLLPEAAWAHAAEHELWFGQQPQNALELARRNAELRPNGESRILLAQALYKAGQAAAAHREIEAVLASAWNTAELHVIAAQIDAALGLREEADHQHALALELNLRAFRMYHLPQPAQPEALP